MKTSAPLVSIGLPVYNGGVYLASAIESVLTQTVRDLELIVADNNSTDDSADIADSYARADSRVQVHRHPENIGAHRNYRFTLERATGEFFKWAAHDDLIHPQFIEKTLDAFAKNPNLGLAFCDMAVIDEQGELTRIATMQYDYMCDSPYRRFRQFFGEELRGEQVFGLTKTVVLRTTGQLADAPGSDVTLVSELLLRGPMAIIHEPLFLNRDHPDRYTRMRASASGFASLWYGTDAGPERARDLNRYRWYRAGIGRSEIDSATRLRCEAFVFYWLARKLPGIVAEGIRQRSQDRDWVES